MIADRDIWRAANLLIREHGTNAEIVAAIESVAECPHGPGIGQSVGVADRCAIGSNPGLPKSLASVAVVEQPAKNRSRSHPKSR